jgi:hypothetical protein
MIAVASSRPLDLSRWPTLDEHLVKHLFIYSLMMDEPEPYLAYQRHRPAPCTITTWRKPTHLASTIHHHLLTTTRLMRAHCTQRAEPSSNGFQVQNTNINTNSFVQTLTGAGTAQNMLTLGPCAGNSAHSHPRGAEISIVVRGMQGPLMAHQNSLPINQLPFSSSNNRLLYMRPWDVTVCYHVCMTYIHITWIVQPSMG